VATSLNIESIRSSFPALHRDFGGETACYFDGPGGTQMSQSVIDEYRAILEQGNSNLGGLFATSIESGEVVDAGRLAFADFFNSRPDEVVFGQNMTTLTFSLSRALAQTWRTGDEIILTRLDHDANISPWLLVARERGVKVRWVDFDPAQCRLDVEDIVPLLNDRTRLLAITNASNAVGTIVDISKACRLAHSVGAVVYVDAVHYAPHRTIDVQDTACDILVSSAYKFYGPHLGVAFVRRDLMEELRAFKVRPAPDHGPGKWETGTQNFEAIAAATAGIDYLASLSRSFGGQIEGEAAPMNRRSQLVHSYSLIRSHERALAERFLEGIEQIPGLRVYGITDHNLLDERTPTFAISMAGSAPELLAGRLAKDHMFVWHGHYYAVAVMERLELLQAGGLVRIGFSMYNTAQEIDLLLEALHRLEAD